MQKTKLWSKNFVLILIVNFLIFTNHFMIISTFPFYIESLGGTAAVAGAAATLFSVVAVVCRPFVGWMLDNGKRKTILLIGIIGMCLMPLGYIIVPVLFINFIFRMIHGSALSFSSTGCSTITTDIIPKTRFAEGMGMFGMAIALATAFAPALGLTLMSHLGYRILFAAAALIMVCAFILIFLVKTPPINAAKKPMRLKQLINRDAVPASVTIVMFMITFGTIENFVAKFANANSLPSGGIYFAIMSGMVLLTRITTRRVADRRGEGPFVYTCNASMFAAFMLLAFIPNTITFIFSAVLAGYGFGGIEPALQTMAVRNSPPERRGSANSTFLSAYDIGIGLGGGVAGYLITELGYGPMFAILALSNIVSIAIYLFWGKKQPSAFLFNQNI